VPEFLHTLARRARGEASSVRPLLATIYGEPIEPIEPIDADEGPEAGTPRPGRATRRTTPQRAPRPAPAPPPSPADPTAPADGEPPKGDRRAARSSRPSTDAPPSPARPPAGERDVARTDAASTHAETPQPAAERNEHAAPAEAPAPGLPDAPRVAATATGPVEVRARPLPRAGVTPRRRVGDVKAIGGPRRAGAAQTAGAAPAPAAALAQRHAEEPARDDTVTVSIGRVEVRAAPPERPAAPVPPPGPRTSLEDWLAEHERGGGA
jgi:hypothetical protein